MASAAVATGASSSSSASSLTMNETHANTTSHTVTNNNNTAGESSEEGVEIGEPTQQPSQPQPQHQNQQPQQTSESHPAAPVEADNTSNRSDTPLPADLRRILVQVAKTGTCSWMSWDQEVEGSLSASSVTLMTAAKASLGMARQPFSTHRRAQGPPRKKHRNGLHKSRRRFGAADASASRNSTGGGRKRPLFLIGTNPNSVNNGSTYSAPGSVGSGRTSGSEPDDSTHYECDSEGTSATTNSEVSVERLRKTQQLVNVNALQAQSNKLSAASTVEESNRSTPHHHYKTLQQAFGVALGAVLDHFYKHRGGYKLATAEKRRNETLSAIDKSTDEKRRSPLSSEAVFQQRRQRLVNMLLPENHDRSPRRSTVAPSDGPPFTIQRIAEVLVSPERFYTQTHKLFNCLEKLLLVTCSMESFEGSTGGDTAQSRREELEMAALADEKGRQESELRQRRLRRRTSSPTDDMVTDSIDEWGTKVAGAMAKDETFVNDRKKSPIREKRTYGYDNNIQRRSPKAGALEDSSREMLEAAARASLRTRFDHVGGIDPHSSPDRDVRSIAENRGMTNSPPPPSLAMSAAPSNIALQSHTGVTGFVRQHLPEQNGDHHLARVPSPILFSPGNESPMHATTNMHMLQLHHAASLAGRQHSNLASSAENADGRSSTSNSDVDSESDDISLDDSASDRSDGSDSGSVTHYEPFTAARAMALNRMQQQQRLQSRVLTSLNLYQSEGFRPPADSEYQSGDSIDSTRAEDSGGSDSSSSDFTD